MYRDKLDPVEKAIINELFKDIKDCIVLVKNNEVDEEDERWKNIVHRIYELRIQLNGILEKLLIEEIEKQSRTSDQIYNVEKIVFKAAKKKNWEIYKDKAKLYGEFK